MRRQALAIAILAVLPGCAGYRAGSFADGQGRFAGQRRVVGCLDVAVAPGADPAAQGPVAEYAFGNRCDAAVPVDLGAVRASARYPDGRTLALALHDPAGAIRPALLDGRRSAREVIEYALPAAGPAELCLDLAGLDQGAAGAGAAVVCLGGLR